MKRFEVQVAFYVDADDEEDAFQQIDEALIYTPISGYESVINPDVEACDAGRI